MARPGAARTIGAGRLRRPRQRFPTRCPLLAQSGHRLVRCTCLLLTQSVLCTAECSLRFIGIPLRRPCAASLQQRCQRNSFGAPARSRTCSQGARPPQTLSPCSWLVLLPVMANEPSLFSTSFSSKARRRRETIPIDEKVATGRPLFEKCISGYLTGSLWSRRGSSSSRPSHNYH